MLPARAGADQRESSPQRSAQVASRAATALAMLLVAGAVRADVHNKEKTVALNVMVPDAKELLSRLKKDHPRLMATSEDFEQVRKLIAEGGRAAQ